MPFRNHFRDRRVLVTGHTGFKGSWLSAWLLELGAEVAGFSLPGEEPTPMFRQLDLPTRARDLRGDVRDLAAVRTSVASFAPDFVFHLAAQPLVRLSYREPVATYGVNVMGTVNVLEAVRTAGRACTVVCITTDKCYENQEWEHSYRENDRLGGHDPYSSSKAAAEIAIAAYRRSYFAQGQADIRVASARSGNVIGGGDWAADRIVPDCVRSLTSGRPVRVRNRHSTRPWQHVLEPLAGYLELAVRLAQSEGDGPLAAAFNFGPGPDSNRTVKDLVEKILWHWPGTWHDDTDPTAPHEASLLNLSIEKSRILLGWRPVWNFEETVAETVTWYRETAVNPHSVATFTRAQIARYVETAAARGLAWTRAS